MNFTPDRKDAFSALVAELPFLFCAVVSFWMAPETASTAAPGFLTFLGVANRPHRLRSQHEFFPLGASEPGDACRILMVPIE
jgi:hypothetical protein